MGYVLPFDQLTIFDVEVFTLIASEFGKLEHKQMKSKSARKR